MFRDIYTKGKPCDLMKAIKTPKYGSKTILTNSSWEYVALFLQRQSSSGAGDALFYWNQAHSFYLASLTLPDDARPLTSYYCILNAAKALLRFNAVEKSKLSKHGISSVRATDDKTNLREAKTLVKGAGVLPELSRYFDNPLVSKQYSMFDFMYNIPCIHRAFCTTFSKPEIFVPISHPIFVKKDSSKKAWLKFSVDSRYSNGKSLKSIPSSFEHDPSTLNEFIIRAKKRFDWDVHTPIDTRKANLQKYHMKMRHYIYYIHGETKLWYLKKEVVGNEELFQVSSPVLIFSVFHWLSELVRYDPRLFQKYMKSRQNWLLHEFINTALNQFVDEISCEITGEDIMCTGYRK